MKKILPALLIALSLVQISSCEKDDICVDDVTPLLIFGFFDITDTTLAKAVPALRVKEIELDSVIDTFDDRISTLDSIGVPLRTDGVSTSYAFITNSADDGTTGEETGSIDSLTITYTTREAFVSRACGFVINFDDLAIDISPNGDDWIQEIRIVQTTLENSNNIHVKIFH